MPGRIEIIGGNPTIAVKDEGQGTGSFFVILPRNIIYNRKTEIRIGLYDGDKKIDEIKRISWDLSLSEEAYFKNIPEIQQP